MPKDIYKNAEENLKKLKAGKLGRIARIKRTAKELIYGSKTYLPKKKKKKKKSAGTVRVEQGLRRGNALTEKEIARFGGK